MISNSEKSIPIVSVIIATHNRANVLPVAVQSILSQTLQDFEIILIDDASSDETPSLIRELMEIDRRIRKIRSEKNIGPGAARNLGINQAQGKFIAIMDDDDFSHPNRLQKQVEVLEAEENIGLVFSAVRWMDEEMVNELGIFPDILLKGEFISEPTDVFALIYLQGSKIPNPTIMVRKSIFQLFPYPTKQYIGEDWHLLLRLAASGVHFYGIPECLVDMRRGAGHVTLSKVNEDYFKAQRLVLKEIKEWLRENDIHQFDHLHTRALSNQIAGEALIKPGFLGLKRGLSATWIDPLNKFAWETTWFFIKAVVKDKLLNRINRV